MASPTFWVDKVRAQAVIQELNKLRTAAAGGGEYDKGSAIITLLAGAGGDDAEDFAAMLFNMYLKYTTRRGWSWSLIHKNENDHGGYRNITFEITGKSVYGILKNESGVHRLVRISPFSARQLRHTSFVLVEVLPKFARAEMVKLSETDLRTEFARSSGPGGQNVNKRETAVRVVHLPTGIAVHADGERSQAANRDRAMEILQAKLYKRQEAERQAKIESAQISRTTEVEWGNQIRSYVLHPYKMVKDHRTGAETAQIQAVLDGNLDIFIEAEKEL